VGEKVPAHQAAEDNLPQTLDPYLNPQAMNHKEPSGHETQTRSLKPYTLNPKS